MARRMPFFVEFDWLYFFTLSKGYPSSTSSRTRGFGSSHFFFFRRGGGGFGFGLGGVVFVFVVCGRLTSRRTLRQEPSLRFSYMGTLAMTTSRAIFFFSTEHGTTAVSVQGSSTFWKSIARMASILSFAARPLRVWSAFFLSALLRFAFRMTAVASSCSGVADTSAFGSSTSEGGASSSSSRSDSFAAPWEKAFSRRDCTSGGYSTTSSLTSYDHATVAHSFGADQAVAFVRTFQ
mmetsp:Transcript_3012/g.10032  ORF Transcript_3012/g.10032 Transcript_3012/m.10032 type:complete len:235 (+) Transcript_3012:1523-2227(+)